MPVVPAIAEFAVDSPLCSRASFEDAEGVSFRSALPLRCEDGRNAVQVLLVGCDSALQSHLRQHVLAPQWTVQEIGGGAMAFSLLEQQKIDLVLVAPTLPDLDAREFQQLLKVQFPSLQVHSLEGLTLPRPDEPATTPEAGPFPDRLPLPAIGKGRSTLPVPSGDAHVAGSWQGIVGTSACMQRVFRTAALVAPRNTTVLIGGESGTGKDLLARGIHQVSARARQPFVIINCAAIPESLLEAELFGHTKGAFTGASQARTGRVHAAHGGTLFLDEIGEMPLPLQSKILRFLEQGEVQRIGSTDTLRVDCRIIAATNVNLREQVAQKQFREDLYYRLAVMPIAVPALRERMSDLPALCSAFLQKFCPGTELSAEALQVLMEHSWPGNIRELRNVMERASLFAEGRQEIRAEDIVL